LHNMLLRRSLEERYQQLQVLEASVLEQVPVVESAENLHAFLQDRSINEVIFISPAAVDFGADNVLRQIELSRVFAVGKGTAKLLQAKLRKMPLPQKNIDVLYPTIGAGSEALLQLSEMQQMRGQQCLIVTGAQGKPHLEQTLVSRGVIVSRWECYQRQKPEQLGSQLKVVFQQPVDFVFLHSAHAAKHFVEELPHLALTLEMSAIVGAEAIAASLRELGWQGQVSVAKSPMPKDMLVCLDSCLRAK